MGINLSTNLSAAKEHKERKRIQPHHEPRPERAKLSGVLRLVPLHPHTAALVLVGSWH